MQRDNWFAFEILQEVGPEAEAAIPYLVQELLEPRHMNSVYQRTQVILMLKGFDKKAWATTLYFIEALRKEQSDSIKQEIDLALKEITGRDVLSTNADHWQKWWQDQHAPF